MPISNTLHGRDHSAFKEVGQSFFIDSEANIIRATGGICSIYPRSYNDGDAVSFHFDSQGRLKVDTELTLDGDVIVDNLGVYATDISDFSTVGLALIDSDGHVQTDVLSLPGGLTGQEEDSPHTSGDVGFMALGVRADAGGSLVDADSDYAPLQVNDLGCLRIDTTTLGGEDIATTSTIINETAVSADPGDSYSSEVEMLPYKDISFQLYLQGGVDAAANDETVTVTVEGTNDLEIAATTRWVDITKSTYNANDYSYENATFAATGATAVDFLLDLDNCNYEKVRLKYTWSGDPDGTDGAIVAIARRKSL